MLNTNDVYLISLYQMKFFIKCEETILDWKSIICLAILTIKISIKMFIEKVSY